MVIPRREYEEFSRWRKVMKPFKKTFTPTKNQKKILKKLARIIKKVIISHLMNSNKNWRLRIRQKIYKVLNKFPEKDRIRLVEVIEEPLQNPPEAGLEGQAVEEQPPTGGEEPPTEEVCDGLDNDCDELIDEDLGQTFCGIGACQVTIDNCIGGQPQTCTPGTPAEEICDQIDNNCDGEIDEGSVCETTEESPAE